MVPVHIWYIHSLSAFYLWIGLCGRLRACLRSGLLQVGCWECLFFCFCLRVSRVVGSLTDRRCWCWGWNLYLLFSIFVLVRVCTSFHICTCLSIGVRRTAGARLNSCYTPVTPSRVIHVCLQVFAFHPCSRLCTVLFQVLVICLLCLLLPSIFFVCRYLWQNSLRCECDQV